jgi:peptidoglycan/LPS O-acetylase OafA/YrhL
MSQMPPLPRHLSLHLDLVRFAAACVVALGHYGSQRVSGGVFYQASAFGPAAVDVFFVLSGFVIAASVADRPGSAAVYVVARWSRLWSVVVPALLLTLVLDAIGSRIDPQFYATIPQFRPDLAWISYPAALLFLNEVWFSAWQPGSNLPYWSLGFEAWYYACFGVFVFAPARWRVAGVLALLVLAGPKVAVLFPLWLLGVAAHRLCRRPPPAVWLSAILAAAPALLLALWPAWHHRIWVPFQALSFDWHVLADYRYDYIVGLLFVAHIIGLRGLADVLPMPGEAAVRLIRWLGGLTFGIYLFHYPVMHVLAVVLPWPVGSAPSRIGIALGTAATVLVLAHLAEGTRPLWRAKLGRLLGGGR